MLMSVGQGVWDGARPATSECGVQCVVKDGVLSYIAPIHTEHVLHTHMDHINIYDLPMKFLLIINFTQC